MGMAHGDARCPPPSRRCKQRSCACCQLTEQSSSIASSRALTLTPASKLPGINWQIKERTSSAPEPRPRFPLKSPLQDLKLVSLDEGHDFIREQNRTFRTLLPSMHEKARHIRNGDSAVDGHTSVPGNEVSQRQRKCIDRASAGKSRVRRCGRTFGGSREGKVNSPQSHNGAAWHSCSQCRLLDHRSSRRDLSLGKQPPSALSRRRAVQGLRQRARRTPVSDRHRSVGDVPRCLGRCQAADAEMRQPVVQRLAAHFMMQHGQRDRSRQEWGRTRRPSDRSRWSRRPPPSRAWPAGRGGRRASVPGAASFPRYRT